MRQFLILCLTFLVSGPAWAQDLSSYPIEGFQQVSPGNFWIFRTTITSGSPDAPAHYIMHRVIGDTLLEGKQQPLIRSLEMDEAGNELSYSVCALDRESGRYPVYTVLEEGGNQSCKLGLVADVMRPSQYTIEAPKDIRIEFQPYTVDAVLHTGGWNGLVGRGGTGWEYSRAWGVGALHYRTATSCTGCTTKGWRLDLVYARINGSYWGVSPALAVTTEPEPEMPGPSALAVFPNPTVEGFTVDVGPERTTIQVYDLLGREVRSASGSGEMRIERGALPPGIYMVRAGTQTRSVILR